MPVPNSYITVGQQQAQLQQQQFGPENAHLFIPGFGYAQRGADGAYYVPVPVASLEQAAMTVNSDGTQVIVKQEEEGERQQNGEGGGEDEQNDTKPSQEDIVSLNSTIRLESSTSSVNVTGDSSADAPPKEEEDNRWSRVKDEPMDEEEMAMAAATSVFVTPKIPHISIPESAGDGLLETPSSLTAIRSAAASREIEPHPHVVVHRVRTEKTKRSKLLKPPSLHTIRNAKKRFFCEECNRGYQKQSTLIRHVAKTSHRGGPDMIQVLPTQVPTNSCAGTSNLSTPPGDGQQEPHEDDGDDDDGNESDDSFTQSFDLI